VPGRGNGGTVILLRLCPRVGVLPTEVEVSAVIAGIDSVGSRTRTLLRLLLRVETLLEQTWRVVFLGLLRLIRPTFLFQ
jgi:hypothetical protein